jgi:glycosyltransferase involved in cell wall biosynthesis
VTARLSVVLPVRNEEENLPDALASVEWVDEVVVVDSHSTDRTVEIARAAGARVVQFDHTPGGPKKKAWALTNLPLRNDWVFLLDADERVPPPLRDEIERTIGRAEHDGYYVDRDMIFMGRSLKSYGRNWNLRLFRRGLARMEDLGLSDLPGTGDNEIHEHVVVDGSVGFLEHQLDHDDYRSLAAWLERHNRYSTWEAHLYRRFLHEPLGIGPLGFFQLDFLERKRVLRRLWVRLPLRAPLRFLIWYVGRGGFRDGRPGLVYSTLMGYYEFITGVKLRELEESSSSGALDGADIQAVGDIEEEGGAAAESP